jgi:hypothetical protein
MNGIDTLSALAGIVSPVALFAPVLYAAAQREHYSHLRQAISDLGSVGAPDAAIVNVGIVCAGLFAAASSYAVRNAFGERGWSIVGMIALVLGGLALAGTALSPWRGDPTDLSLLPNKLHLIAALIGFLGISVAPIMFGLQLRGTLGTLSIGVGLVVLALAFWPFQGDYRGLFQRAALGTFFFWLVLICASKIGATAWQQGSN